MSFAIVSVSVLPSFWTAAACFESLRVPSGLNAALVVVDEHARGDVHRVDEDHPDLHAALADQVLHVGGPLPPPAKHDVTETRKKIDGLLVTVGDPFSTRYLALL